jgi:hypothetical protein
MARDFTAVFQLEGAGSTDPTPGWCTSLARARRSAAVSSTPGADLHDDATSRMRMCARVVTVRRALGVLARPRSEASVKVGRRHPIHHERDAERSTSQDRTVGPIASRPLSVGFLREGKMATYLDSEPLVGSVAAALPVDTLLLGLDRLNEAQECLCLIGEAGIVAVSSVRWPPNRRSSSRRSGRSAASPRPAPPALRAAQSAPAPSAHRVGPAGRWWPHLL